MNKICELRKRKNITQQISANDLGVNRATVTKWEAGTNNPTAEKLKELADYFNVTTDYLLGRDSPVCRNPAEQSQHVSV